MPFIPFGRQDISETDIQAVVYRLRSDFLTQGPVMDAFKKAIAMYCGVFDVVALSGATATLHDLDDARQTQVVTVLETVPI